MVVVVAFHLRRFLCQAAPVPCSPAYTVKNHDTGMSVCRRSDGRCLWKLKGNFMHQFLWDGEHMVVRSNRFSPSLRRLRDGAVLPMWKPGGLSHSPYRLYGSVAECESQCCTWDMATRQVIRLPPTLHWWSPLGDRVVVPASRFLVLEGTHRDLFLAPRELVLPACLYPFLSRHAAVTAAGELVLNSGECGFDADTQELYYPLSVWHPDQPAEVRQVRSRLPLFGVQRAATHVYASNTFRNEWLQ